MNSHSDNFKVALAISTGMLVLLSGCNRTETPPPNMANPSTTSAAPATTMGVEVDDSVVTTKVKSALLGDADVKGLDIKVETRKGMVQLSGFVDNQLQIDRATAVTRGVEGVKSVESSMTLKNGKLTAGNQIDDGVITANVKSALLAEQNVKSFDIGVVTRKGEVQLSGYVNNQAQIDRAIEVTRSVSGVTGVVNEMSVKK
ncbi:BON domain-containing protein [Rhodocyclus tenuis]|uniref:Osmotically-inducible protein Y n=1 Tax=Rhodocyclus tenuis TaxID=1066 RepID=A0A840FZH4_RHOTE|nr:BON domain-containing protein [Rhodocyclus tenuis]MBB4247517.1 hyperosmotically inducible protein [Rhodocyclus tenuis]